MPSKASTAPFAASAALIDSIISVNAPIANIFLASTGHDSSRAMSAARLLPCCTGGGVGALLNLRAPVRVFFSSHRPSPCHPNSKAADLVFGHESFEGPIWNQLEV